jgi:cell wall-associated NlpC family hydrolase
MISILGPVRKKALGIGVAAGIVLAGGAGYAAFGREDTSSASGPTIEASIDSWRWAPSDELPSAPKEQDEPEPTKTEPAETADEAETETLPENDPAPKTSATGGGGKPDELAAPGEDGEYLKKAEVLKNGVALPPLEAPEEVRAIFEAGNTIARSPYIWGGGHGKWQDKGYDCSGSVSYALAAAGFLNAPQASGPLMSWGKPGKGKWITIYANEGHVFMVVAGVRFDTVARGQTGSRWINDMTDTSRYVARHPQGF